MTRRVREIIMSDFTMVPHADGGWAVPGGGRITTRDLAEEFAREWNQILITLKRAKGERK